MRKNDLTRRKEHERVREKVGYYDFTHQLLEVKGEDARIFLDKVFVNSIKQTKPGTAKYTTMLNNEGLIIDDVIVFCLEEELFWISTLFIDDMKAWLNENKEDKQIEIKDITKEYSMWAIQGPNSRDLLNEILRDDISDMKFFDFKKNYLKDMEVMISRSGFTGELGYEIYFDPDKSNVVEEEILDKGKKYDALNIETDVVLTSLPIEKGYVMMDDLENTTPLETGFAWSVKWDKDFIGKDNLEDTRNKNKRKLLGFILDGEDADIETNSIIKIDGIEVGRVTKATYGYTVEETIGYALLDANKGKIGDKIIIVNGNDELTATLVDKVFYDPEDSRRYVK